MCWKRTPEVNAFIISKYFCLKSNLPAWSLVCWWSCLADSGFQELSCCLRQLLIIVQWHYVQSNMENWAIAYSFKGWLHEHQMSGVMATSRQVDTETVVKTLILYLISDPQGWRERERENWEWHGILKSFPNSPFNYGQRIQIYEFIGTILVQTTTVGVETSWIIDVVEIIIDHLVLYRVGDLSFFNKSIIQLS